VIIIASFTVAESAEGSIFTYLNVLANRIRNIGRDISVLGRLSEVRYAFDEIKNDWISLIFGNGFGSTYYAPDIMDFAGSADYYETNLQVHNIHIGPVSVYFRLGILGFLVYYVFLPHTLISAFRKGIRKEVSFLFISSLSWLFLKWFESFQALRFVGDPAAMMIFAMCLRFLKRQSLESTELL